MNITLTPQLERFVHGKVKRGRYNSASEVVREALRLLEERDNMLDLRRQAIRKKIDEGWESLEGGRGLDGEEVFAELLSGLDHQKKTRQAG
jgi:antitoxin ParD1/3/4